MKIEFIGPAVGADDGGISFKVLVDGQTVACRFSMEALQDIKPAITTASAADQFEASKSTLLALAEKKISAGMVSNGVVQIFTRDL